MKQVFIFCFGIFIWFPTKSQELAFEKAEKLSSSINTAAEESMPLLSPNGKTLFFTRFMHDKNVGGRYSGQDVWFSKFEGSKWGKADNNILPVNNKNNNAVIGISADGNVLYLLNASSEQELKGIHLSRNINGSWTKPELIPIDGLDHQGFVGFYVSPEFDIILLSMKGRDSVGEEDLYVCLKNASGAWLKPKNLGTTVNTTGFEISPFLSPDKKRLYFSSNGHKGRGSADVFYCDRLYNSWETWTPPKNLGEQINSPSFDAYFSIQGDSLAFLSSNRGGRTADIYRVRISKEKTTDQEYIDKMIEEANAILADLKNSNDDRKTIIFKEESFHLSETAKTDLFALATMIKGSNKSHSVEIQAFYSTEGEKNDNNGVFLKRIDEIRKYLVGSGIKSTILVSMKESRSQLQSSRYVSVIASVK